MYCEYQKSPSIFEYIRNLTGTRNSSEKEATLEELTGPVIGLGVTGLGYILIMSILVTLPSLSTIISSIKVSLFIGGKLKCESNEDNPKAVMNECEDHISTECIMLRNELPIYEIGVESIYQFMFQWAIFFTFHYWLSLASKAKAELSLSNVSEGNYIAPNNSSPMDEIHGLEHVMDFGFIWKSGLISWICLSKTQIKMNGIQHQLSISNVQEMFYLFASACNTASFASLLVLMSMTIFDTIILLRDCTTRALVLLFSCTFTISPFLIRVVIMILDKLRRNQKPQAEYRDKIATASSLGNFINLSSPQMLLLPTSQTPQPYIKLKKWGFSYYVSYHHMMSSELHEAFVNQCIYYSITLIGSSLLGTLHLYLLYQNETMIGLSKILDISPTGISHIRYNFMIICCFVVPLGWFLGNFFLYQYFTFDDGYFSVAKISFKEFH